MSCNNRLNTVVPAIRISAWNINGLISKDHDKTKDPTFISLVNENDIVILTETKCQSNQTIYIPGYYSFHLYRRALETAKTESGGIIILCK